MHEIIKAVILGIVEGITEFLPISSTGHLILVNQFVAFSEPFTKKFDVIIQLGAILSVVVYFRKRLFPMDGGWSSFFQTEAYNIWKKIIVGVIPALIIGALFYKKIVDLLFNPATVAIALVLGGVAIIILERWDKQATIQSIGSLGYSTAFFIGLIQCLSMIPGTSRSAATIIGAMVLGCSRLAAVEFSFFLAIPTIFAATVYSIYKMGLSITGSEIIVLIVGFVVSFFTAWLVVAGFMSFISKRNFKPFGYYRILLGGVILLYFLLQRYNG
jgi:undecaprenyl-diphosphatase